MRAIQSSCERFRNIGNLIQIDINLIRKNPDLVRDSERRRGRSTEVVDKVVEIDKEWRVNQFNQEQLRKEQNVIAKQIGQLKKTDASADASVCTQRMNPIRLNDSLSDSGFSQSGYRP